MSWLYEKPRPIDTSHNGVMWLSRLFGAWRLHGHDGTEQATPYMDALWRKALRRVVAAAAARDVRTWKPRRVLVLGVAMGGTLALVRRRWPAAEIVGVDWEPSLYELGQRLGVWRPDARSRYVEGDALAAVPALEGSFDLVLVDLFRGQSVAAAATDPVLLGAVAACLAPGAFVVVNAFRQPPSLDRWRERFGTPTTFRYEGNLIAVFHAA